MNLEHPPQSALEWLDRMLAYIHKLEAENIRLDQFIRNRPTGTKIQREQQILKRMEAAEKILTDDPTDEMLNAAQKKLCELHSITHFSDHDIAEMFKAMIKEKIKS